MVAGLLFVACHTPPAAHTKQPALPRNKPIETTLQEIIAGNFKSAIDKQGHGGTRVTVRNLTVVSVASRDDGDFHVVVTDGTAPPFITEIIPRDRSRGLTIPPVGAHIDETGTPYLDTHSNEPLHEYTDWEIHPVTGWNESATSSTG